MIRVSLRIEPNYRERFAPWLAVAGRLRDAGFALAMHDDGDADGDINLVQSIYLRKAPARMRRLGERGLAIYERTDTEPVSPSAALRALIEDRRVHAHLKDVVPRVPALHNSSMVARRHHLTFLPDGTGRVPPAEPPDVALRPAALAKIGSFIPIHLFPRMDPFVDRPSPPISRRPIEIAFAGTVEFRHDQITLHRRRAIQAIAATGRKAAIVEGNRLARADYREFLARTRIFVSPYGLGGFSWKDFEAIYMGAIVVKPDCAFAETYGFDVYGARGYVLTCRPDFADLGDVVGRALDDLPGLDILAERNRAAIHAARDLDGLADDLIALLTAVRDGGPLPPNRELGRGPTRQPAP